MVQTLMLKRDAQVMLVKNVSETLVNGSVGRVVAFCERPAAIVSQQQKQQKQKNEIGGHKEVFPLVEFSTFKGKETKLVTSEEFRVEDGEGNLLARRIQVSSATQMCPINLQHHMLTTIPTSLDPTCASMGNVHPQSTRSDHPAGQG